MAIFSFKKLVYLNSTRESQISISQIFSFQKPSGWIETKRPNKNEILLSYDDGSNPACSLDVFAVKPDKDYTFQIWLGTTLANKIFLDSSQESTSESIRKRSGTYDFYNNQIGNAKNTRTIIKNGISFADFTLSYSKNISQTRESTVQKCVSDMNAMINSSSFK